MAVQPGRLELQAGPLAGANAARPDPTTSDASVRLPLIKGDRWFDTEHRPFNLRVEYPLTAEEMVAALYGVVEPHDVTTDEDLCGSVAVTLLIDGLAGLAARATQIQRDEQRGTVQSLRFLTEIRCRRGGKFRSLSRLWSEAVMG